MSSNIILTVALRMKIIYNQVEVRYKGYNLYLRVTYALLTKPSIERSDIQHVVRPRGVSICMRSCIRKTKFSFDRILADV